ncbi:MAG: calcium/sodium antiporter [Deltaproteobacteria bacterium]|nr:calcium/sodium antiporter [Deltaproteobacteria bacterium]
MTTIVLSLLIIVFCVWVLSVITDVFFIESLDVISEKMELPPSVAGASLMAMGSSAPELAIALLALFSGGGEHSDVGIGTIVGSAVFNVLVITGVSAIAMPAVVQVRTILRDCLFYGLAIGMLLWVFQDGVVVIPEALSFLGLYVFYLVILFKWKEPQKDPTKEEGDLHDDAVVDDIAEEIETQSRLTKLLAKLLGVFSGDPRVNYVRSFVVSVVVIGGICFLLVEAALALAAAMGIPPLVVALTILAGGTSVPDMISSIVVARQGRGDMAVANAIGSNIFDILICLGVPWLLTLAVLGNEVHVDTAGLSSSVIILLATVALLLVFSLSGRVLSRVEGAFLLLAYVAYAIYIWLQPMPAKAEHKEPASVSAPESPSSAAKNTLKEVDAP